MKNKEIVCPETGKPCFEEKQSTLELLIFTVITITALVLAKYFDIFNTNNF